MKPDELSRLLTESAAECLTENLTIFLDVEDYMHALHNNFGHLFKHYGDPVYYLPNVVHPIVDLREGRKYLSRKRLLSGKEQRKPIRSIADVQGDIIDPDGVVILKEAQVDRLTNRPWYPKHELDFIRDYFYAALKNRNPLTKTVDWSESLLKDYFADSVMFGREGSEEHELASLDVRIKIQALLDPLMHHVLEQPAVKTNRYLMFDVTQTYFDLKVLVLGDYRVYQWTVLEGRMLENLGETS